MCPETSSLFDCRLRHVAHARHDHSPELSAHLWGGDISIFKFAHKAQRGGMYGTTIPHLQSIFRMVSRDFCNLRAKHCTHGLVAMTSA